MFFKAHKKFSLLVYQNIKISALIFHPRKLLRIRLDISGSFSKKVKNIELGTKETFLLKRV